jgi:hypothetical protein
VRRIGESSPKAVRASPLTVASREKGGVAVLRWYDTACHDLTKGQRAMQLAMLYPEPEKGGRGNKSKAIKSAETAGFSGGTASEYGVEQISNMSRFGRLP